MRNLVSRNEDDYTQDKRSRLKKALRDWSVYGDYEAFSAWLEYYHHSTLPFAGGWLDQPKWIRDAFSTLNMVYNLHHYEKDIPELPTIPSSPFFSD